MIKFEKNIFWSKNYFFPKKMEFLFNACSSLTSIDLSIFKTSSVDDFSYVFSGCSSLTSLDESHFETSNVNNMRFLFNGCSKVPVIDVSNFDTSLVTFMSICLMLVLTYHY